MAKFWQADPIANYNDRYPFVPTKCVSILLQNKNTYDNTITLVNCFLITYRLQTNIGYHRLHNNNDQKNRTNNNKLPNWVKKPLKVENV